MNSSKLIPCILLTCFLAACGGGSGADGTADTPPNNSQPQPPVESEENWLSLIEEDITAKTEDRLKEIYWGAALARYEGFTDPADITPESVQEFVEILYGDRSHPLYYLGSNGSELRYSLSPGETKEIDLIYNCSLDGSINVNGTDSDNLAKIALDYDSCDDNLPYWGGVSGKGALVSKNLGYDPEHSTRLFNSLSSSYDRPLRILETHTPIHTPIQITGYYAYSEYETTPERAGFSALSRVLYSEPESGIQIILDTEYLSEQTPEYRAISNIGSIKLSDHGSVEISNIFRAPSENQVSTTLTIAGKDGAKATLKFQTTDLAFTLDRDGDGIDDEGKYFQHLGAFAFNDFSENPVVPVSQMDRPPVANKPFFPIYAPGDEDQIEALINYWDYDTPEEELYVTTYWLINNQPLADVSGLILPADRTSPGDVVSLYYEVSDGTHTVTSETAEITISERY